MKIRKPFRGVIVALGAAGWTAGFAGGAHATAILTFGQVGNGSPITGTQTGSVTTIVASNVPVNVTQIYAPVVLPPVAYLNLSLTSTSGALSIADNYEEHFQGSFSITYETGGTVTNLLSGSLTDSAFGLGTAFVISATTPPAANVTYTSDVIPEADLGLDRGAALSFASVDPLLSIVDGTFASFASSVSGTFSADPPLTTPEPSSLALLGAGLFGVGMLRLRRA
nr:PEP-CTERM sorting domain-containing protein [uncultured Rhodopila sp.]